jgi:hypothetical protein
MIKVQRNLKVIKKRNKWKKLGQLLHVAQSYWKMVLRELMLKAFATLT